MCQNFRGSPQKCFISCCTTAGLKPTFQNLVIISDYSPEHESKNLLHERFEDGDWLLQMQSADCFSTHSAQKIFLVLAILTSSGLICYSLFGNLSETVHQFITETANNSPEQDQAPSCAGSPATSDLQLQTSMPDNGIFFLETSNLPFLTPKQLCAVESAAFHHRSIPVVAVVTAEHLLLTRTIEKLFEVYPNVDFAKVATAALLEGTPLSKWFKTGALAKSPFKIGHTSDVMRAALLYKHGGIYLDLDVIVMRNLTMPNNSVPRSYLSGWLSNGVLAFEKNHAVLKEHMEEISAHYAAHNWDQNGPRMLTTVVSRRCEGGKLPNNITQPAFCKDVHVLPADKFYPFPSAQWPDLFKDDPNTATRILSALDDTILLHYWNHYSEKSAINANSRQALGLLAKRHCPVVVSSSSKGVLWGRT